MSKVDLGSRSACRNFHLLTPTCPHPISVPFKMMEAPTVIKYGLDSVVCIMIVPVPAKSHLCLLEALLGLAVGQVTKSGPSTLPLGFLPTKMYGDGARVQGRALVLHVAKPSSILSTPNMVPESGPEVI